MKILDLFCSREQCYERNNREMQMIKNDKGVTMVVLVITIVILLMLTTVGLNVGYSSINGIIDQKLKSELGMVKQAATEQYLKAATVNKIEVPLEENAVVFWVGTRLTNFSEISFPAAESITLTKDAEDFFAKEASYAPVYQEDCYYRLTPSDLNKIGIGDAKDTYIVNYKTGEVYNETEQVDKGRTLLYLPATNEVARDTEEVDNTFNDWDK